MNKYYGYAGWKLRGQELFGKTDPNLDIELMSLTELGEKKLKAEEWLSSNTEDKNYEKALKRYELICDRIKKLESTGVVTDLL